MTRFFTSDNHFGHTNIIKYCDRPFASSEEMDEAMIARWNKAVRPSDTVYHIGDFAMSFNKVEEITPQLNGKKILIAGNHDYCHPAHKKGKKDVLGWADKYLRAGWSEVTLSIPTLVLLDGTVVQVSHMPFVLDHPTDIKYSKYRPTPIKDRWLIHGHIHNHNGLSIRAELKQIDVGVDGWNFTPIPETQIIEIVRS